MSDFIKQYIKALDDTYLVSLRDTNAQVAEQYQRNADSMVKIVNQMDEEIRERGLR